MEIIHYKKYKCKQKLFPNLKIDTLFKIINNNKRNEELCIYLPKLP